MIMRLFKEQFLPCDRGHSSLKSCCRPNKERVFAVKQYPAGVSKMADFPRGGASTLSPLEVQRIKDSAMQDVLFGVSNVACIENQVFLLIVRSRGNFENLFVNLNKSVLKAVTISLNNAATS